MNMTDLIAQFCDDIQFDALEEWCTIFDIDFEYPQLDEMYPDWEDELRVKLAEAMEGVGK
jgi:hypothetical protein